MTFSLSEEYLDRISDLEIRVLNLENIVEYHMDKKIIAAKKKNDKQMDKLVKEDIKRDKACDKAKEMAKKKK